MHKSDQRVPCEHSILIGKYDPEEVESEVERVALTGAGRVGGGRGCGGLNKNSVLYNVN